MRKKFVQSNINEWKNKLDSIIFNSKELMGYIQNYRNQMNKCNKKITDGFRKSHWGLLICNTIEFKELAEKFCDLWSLHRIFKNFNNIPGLLIEYFINHLADIIENQDQKNN